MSSIKKIKHTYIVAVICSLIILSCGKEEIPKSTLVVRDNILYKRGSNVPFTGREKALVDKKIIEYDVKDGYKHGEFKIYSEDEILEIQGQLDSNRNVGKWQYFYADGTLESEGNFILDKPDGEWIWNYPDGKLKEKGEYKNGVRTGMWYQYDNSGNITYEHKYEPGDFDEDSSSI